MGQYHLFISARAGALTRLWTCSSATMKAFAIASMILATACVPKNTPVASSKATSSGPSYAGFTGATSAQTIGPTKVKVSWNASTDTSVVAYNIYDATLLFNPKLIKTVPAGTTSVSLTNLTNEAYYSFRVRAVNTNQVEDGNTNDVSAIPYGGVLPAQVSSSTSAVIPFNDAQNADSIVIQCQVGTSTDWTPVATITNVTLTQYTLNGLQAGVSYTCRAALVVNGFTDNNTVTTTFIPVGQASQLVFSTQPGSAGAGSAFSTQPVVTIKDVNGNIVSAGPDATSIITLTISANSPSQGTIRGTASLAAVKGVATFTGLNMQETGVKIISATKSDTSSQAHGSPSISQDSASFTITAGTVSATKSTIAISPAVPPNSALVANGSNSYTVTITLLDQYGNPIIGTKPTFASNISGDTLTQPVVATDNNGQATGSISSTVADTNPARVLNIASPSGLSTVTTLAPFVPGAPAKLAFTVQPVNSPSGALGLAPVKVAIQDAQGNTITTGASASGSISMAIAANTSGATLTGTTTVTATNGIATFGDLGISKTQTGYKLLASSGSLTPAYSNAFNVTAGTPQKIVITGPTSILSGVCSSAVTIQLQDAGSNPSNAIQNTPITVSGLSGASMYSSSSCSGSPLSTSMTFTAGTNTKTIYLKDAKAEQTTMTGTDPSGVLATGTYALKSSASQVQLIAQMPAPAAAGTPMSVVSGQCSAVITITPLGADNYAGPLFNSTTVAVTGITGTQATLYSDSSCSTPLTATNVPLTSCTGSQYSTCIYVKDSKAESLNLSVTDPNSVLSTYGAIQPVSITASNIVFTGPASVVSGQCSTAFTITLKDAAGNAVPAPSNTTLTLNGLGGTQGAFYTSAGLCSSGSSPTTSSVTVPASASSVQIFFKDSTAENISVRLTDPAGLMTQSAILNIGVSPSALKITTGASSPSATSVCAGPFTINTMDGNNHVTNAITPITVNLTGQGTGGGFFSDAACSSSATQFVFAAGVSAQTFYFKGQYPATSLTFTAADQAGVLSSATQAWVVTAAPGFIGTQGTMFDTNNNLIWFTKGVVPVAARMDGPSSSHAVHLDASGYMYVSDPKSSRVLKYDYANKAYIGWIGEFNNTGAVGITGSNLTSPVNASASCSNTAWGSVTPYWCIGGQAQGDGNTANGGMNYPNYITDDGTYLYVAQRNSHTVNRYDLTNGTFAGYIGLVGSSSPTGAGPGGPGSCTSTTTGNPTPGWCKGGSNNYANGNPGTGNGGLRYPRGVAYANGYLYVGNQGSINRYNVSDGSFAGWIGWVSTTPTGAATGGPASCSTTASGHVTPGWCTGGAYALHDPRNYGGLNDPSNIAIIGSTLYVTDNSWGNSINTYDVNSGAWLGTLSVSGLINPSDLTTDGTYIYVADWYRVFKMDATGTVYGWFGKVNNNSSMSGTGCSTLQPNSVTPGWCLGGTSKSGMEEQAFNQLSTIAYDSTTQTLITGQYDTFPAIKNFDASTGNYNGTLAFQSTSPTQWSNDSTSVAGYYGFDDNSMYTPEGSYSDGTYLYVAEFNSSRVKKISLATGTLVGWIGGITTSPTGGVSGCLGATPMGPAPGWCTGANFNPQYLWNVMISQSADGIMYAPVAVTGDGTYIYVVDMYLHKVMKFNASTGAYIGWVGAISSATTGPASTACVNATGVTPLWCTGGSSTNGSGDGQLNSPVAITYAGGNIYVVDSSNHRIMSYNASTGAFNGWIGRIGGSNPTSGCTYGSNGSYNVSTNGWCKGGTSQASVSGDRGGGFDFWSGSRGGIATDGTYLYITNMFNYRIDKWSLGGVFQGATNSNYMSYTGSWTTTATTLASWANWGCDYPVGLFTDSTSSAIYGTGYNTCGNGNSVAYKLDKTTGTMVGWRGTINPGNSPTGPTGSSCIGATTVTPTWCQGGLPTAGYRLGQFTGNAYGISGDANFVYVSDENSHRVTRLPK